MSERHKPTHHRQGPEMYKVLMENLKDNSFLIERGNFEGYLASSRMFQVLHKWVGDKLNGVELGETVVFRRRTIRNGEEVILPYTTNFKFNNAVEELEDDRFTLDELIDAMQPERITTYLDSLVQRI